MGHLQNRGQSGVVSIFVVIFSALLITIVTVSFVSVMMRNQQQASNADLSNSAYDAALAGVEDAKRLLLQYRECQRSGAAGTCERIRAAVDSGLCNSVKHGLYGAASDDFSEVLIQRTDTDENSKALDQAYTCVQIAYKTDDLTGKIQDGESKLLPIESDDAFSKVRISWFLKQNGDNRELVVQAPDVTSLPPRSEWQTDENTVKPPVVRTQWIQTGPSFKSEDFDGDSGGSNTNTLFLYPSRITDTTSFGSEIRPAGAPKAPTRVECVDNDQYQRGNIYACSIVLDLPSPIGGARSLSFLQLEAIYGETDYKIELLNSTDGSVKVIAPEVDSTGRASNLFRRVKARIDFAGDYPRAGISVDGNLCKDFGVTNNPADYPNLKGTCTP